MLKTNICVLLFFFSCIASSLRATYFEAPLYSASEILLRNHLAGTLEKLSRETIAIGDPINAFAVEILPDELSNVSLHIGYYFGAEIKTYIARDNNVANSFSESPGYQEIIFKHPSDVSRSASWTVENVGGIDYIVHDHGTFQVYSNATTQYVTSN